MFLSNNTPTMTKSYNKLDIHTLEEKIDVLYARKEVVAKQLESNWNYLQHHYPSIIGNTIFKRKAGPRQTASILGYMLAIPVFQKTIRYITGKILGKAEEVLLRWFRK